MPIETRAAVFDGCGSDSIYLRLSLTPECNLRCRYCRPETDPEDGDRKNQLLDRELLDLVGIVHEVKPVRKLRFTGGEPLLKPGLADLITRFRRLLPRSELCLTTNGIGLEKRARSLRQAGVTALNISLDVDDEDRFQALTGSRSLSAVIEGIAAASGLGFRRIKLNTVLLRSCNGDLLASLVRIAARFRCEIRFVELMPIGRGALLFPREYLPAQEALQRILRTFPYIRPELPSATAERHTLDVDGKETAVGFITSISRRFCSGCDRIRLDSLGRIFSCLRQEHGVDLSPSLRAHDLDRLKREIQRILRSKQAPAVSWPGRSMAQLGG